MRGEQTGRGTRAAATLPLFPVRALSASLSPVVSNPWSNPLPFSKLVSRATALIETEGGAFARVFLGSGVFFAVKNVCIALNLVYALLPMWLLYLIVHTLTYCAGWVYHTRVSFQVGFSLASFGRYFASNLVVIVVDFALFTALVYLLRLQPNLASVAVAGSIFLFRYVLYSRFVFRLPQFLE